MTLYQACPPDTRENLWGEWTGTVGEYGVRNSLSSYATICHIQKLFDGRWYHYVRLLQAKIHVRLIFLAHDLLQILDLSLVFLDLGLACHQFRQQVLHSTRELRRLVLEFAQ